MTDLRFAGMGFPNGPVDLGTVFALPSSNLLMLVTEARYHYDEAVRAGKSVLWRAIPRAGKRPAEVGWSPAKAVDEALNLTDTAQEPIRDFVPWNELDLNTERGDAVDDFSDLSLRYALIGGFLYSSFTALRVRLPGTRIHFPAFTPDHDALTYLDRWQAAADLADIVDFHAYDSLDKIQARYEAHRQAFPEKPLALTEWHCMGDVEEERRVLQWLADTMAADSLFEAAYRFIWRWDGAPGWWSPSYDVESNPPMVTLFMNPPATQPLPVPPPAPSPPEPPMPDYRAIARADAVAAGIDPDYFERQINQESGFDPNAYNPSGATGIAQIIPRWHPDVDPTDPVASLAYAANLVAAYLEQFGDYARAFAAYNWGPGNVGGYTKPDGTHVPPWDGSRDALPAETQHYLDVILGSDWDADAPAAVVKLSEVLAKARSRIGDPYVWGGKAPPSTDCSGFVAWCYDGQVTSFTDTIFGETERVADPAPGDIVLYEYQDASQPGVRFPHVALYMDDATVLDNRGGYGVGVHPQLPRSQARRYYRRLAGVAVDTVGGAPVPEPAPTPAPIPVPAPSDDIGHLRDVIGYASHDVADALQKEVTTIRGSLDALEAAIDTLRKQGAA